MPRTASAARRWRADASAVASPAISVAFACARGTMAGGHLVEDHPSGANDGVPCPLSPSRCRRRATRPGATSGRASEGSDEAYASAWRSGSVRTVSRRCSRLRASARAAVANASRCRSSVSRELGAAAQCDSDVRMLGPQPLQLNRQCAVEQGPGVSVVAGSQVEAGEIHQAGRHLRVVRTQRLLPDAQRRARRAASAMSVSPVRDSTFARLAAAAPTSGWSGPRNLSCDSRARSNSGRVRLKSSAAGQQCGQVAEAFRRAGIGETAMSSREPRGPARTDPCRPGRSPRGEADRV